MAYECSIANFIDFLICANNYTLGLFGIMILAVIWYITFSWLQGRDGDVSAATLITTVSAILFYTQGIVSDYVALSLLVAFPVILMLTRK